MILKTPKVFQTLKKMLNPAFFEPKEQLDFWYLRLTIELGLADLLAITVTDQDIEKMEQIVSKEEAAPDNFELRLECDYKFHSLLYQASRNKAIESFQTILNVFFSDIRARRLRASEDFKTRFSDSQQTTHRTILDALRTRDAEMISKTMRKHLSLYFVKWDEVKPADGLNNF